MRQLVEITLRLQTPKGVSINNTNTDINQSYI